MQQMMMQMMQQNQQHNQQPAEGAPAAAAANPQTKEQIQAMLDNLDARFSKGEISEDVYKQLSAKWQEKLKALGG